MPELTPEPDSTGGESQKKIKKFGPGIQSMTLFWTTIFLFLTFSMLVFHNLKVI
jgi:hypothetical protein